MEESLQVLLIGIAFFGMSKKQRTQFGHLAVIDIILLGRITFSPDGNTFITGGKSGIQFWDLNTMQPIPLYTGLPEGYAYGTYSPDGRTLAVSGMHSDVHLLNISTGIYKTIQTGHSGRFTIPAFSVDGKNACYGKFF